MGKLPTVIHKSESYKPKMQRDLVVVLCDNIYKLYKIVKL